ncbi:aspartyl/asparaginyl beta-hydroxylase domain-containing protein [Lysobacter sp. A286]
MTNTAPTPHESHRVDARLAAEAGQLAGARTAYTALLQAYPDDVEALNFIAIHTLSEGHPGRARELLEHALSVAPDDVPTRKNLGVALLHSGDPERARDVLQPAVDELPDYFVARLYLGVALERLGEQRQSVIEYLRALSAAHREGQWRDAQTTPAGLRPVVARAAEIVRSAYPRLLHAVMTPLRERHGAKAMARVDTCLSSYLGEITIKPEQPSQKPTFLYFPGLPETPFLSRDLFPWYEQMEACTDAIRDELLAVLAADGADLVPFLGEPPPGMSSQYLGGRADVKPQWDGLFFHRHGKRNEENCRRCPQTAAALDAAPTVRIRGHAPESLFSVLGAGSHILPHTGVTNTRVVTHLPLLVPGECTLRVADQRHDWQEGRCITFDDTFEHEAWNHSDRTRVILLFDVWNPHMTPVEQSAVTELVSAIADLKGEEL